MATFHGKVTRKLYGQGSKSERSAVCLETPEAVYVLRRQGGNAFRDPELDKLVGKTIEGEGSIAATTLILTSYREVPGKP